MAACGATSTALLSSSSNPKAACGAPIKPSGLASQSLSFPSSFSGLPKSPVPCTPLSSRTSTSKRPCFSVRTDIFGQSAEVDLPLVGNKAPDFAAEAVFYQEFINVKLSEYIGKKYVILFFYPLDSTFVCPIEITAFSDRYEEFEKLNAEVLGVSTDRVFCHLALVQTDRKSGGLGDLKYPMIYDVTKAISKSYGLLIPDQGIALRGLFIIDKEGVIQHSTINNLAIGRSVDETLRTLQALQYVQENPDEVCPAPFPSSNRINNFPPSLSRPKHLHFPPPPPSKHTISHQCPKPPIVSPKLYETASSTNSSSLQEKLLYLDSLGIDSFHCLSSHPPIMHTPLSEIKSIIDFLYSINLTTPDLRRAISMCPEILTSPLSTTLIPVVTFLLREAHVNSRDLCHVIHRRPRLLTCSVDDTLRPTLHFLQVSVGVEDISKWAPLLSCSVEKKFIPRIEYIQRLGFSKKETFNMFRRFPSLFCYSIEENFEPKFNYFVVEMGRELAELVDFPQYFSFSLENRIKPRHQMCVERRVFLSLPVLLRSSEPRFRDRLELCCSSSTPVRTSPLWCTSKSTSQVQILISM